MLPGLSTAEVMVIAAIALIVVGPKDLPNVLRKFGQFVGRMRAMAADFRASFDDMARQSELEELRKEVEAMRASAAEQVSSTNTEISQGLTFEHDPLDPYGAAGAPLDAPPVEPQPLVATAEDPAPAKPKRTRRKAAEPMRAAPVADEVAPKPRRARRKTPGDIVT